MAKQSDIFSGLSWSFLERFTSKAAGLVVTVILARLIYPEAYGTIALVDVFITLGNVFNHLIYKYFDRIFALGNNICMCPLYR